MTPPGRDLRSVLASFGHELSALLWHRELGAQDGQTVRDALERVLAQLRAACARGAAAPLRLEVSGRRLRAAGELLLGPSLQAGKLLDLAAERGIRALTFDPRLDAGELRRFLELLTDERHRGAFRREALPSALAQHAIARVGVELAASEAAPDGRAGRTTALEGYQALASVLLDSHVAASRGESLQVDRAQGVVEQAMARMGSAPSELLALASYDDVDRFTVGHSVRVALLALQVARAAGADHGELLRVGTAALLHDIGKSRIPQEILSKPGPLDAEEWHLMAQHPRFGAEILQEQKEIDPSAIGAAFCHHLAPAAGSGYPRPAIAFEPSGVSKLVRVCDVFEALTAARPYKEPLTPVEAHVVMHREGHGFDPEWLRFFVQVIGLYPLGTRVLLDTGERAVVERHGPACDRPVVRVEEEQNGSCGEPLVVPTGVEHEGVVRRIAKVLPRPRRGREAAAIDRVVKPLPGPCR